MENKEIKRNPAYQFISTDTDEVISDLIRAYEIIVKSTVRPASPEMQFIRWVADVIVHERVLNNWSANQNIPSRADGDNLDALAELTYIQSRPAAKPASCKMRFQISEPQEQAILIPAGTRVTDSSNTLIWETRSVRLTLWWMFMSSIRAALILRYLTVALTYQQTRSIISL